MPGLEKLRARFEVKKWQMWQIAGIGTMFGQARHSREYAREREPLDRRNYGLGRDANEARRT